ncbi:thiamine-repressible mitochondrial transport protein THI74 [Andrographis paniculata]|uniref:thiamine-repressible mitochondrial transport protein THI74 n=1 Tax=Andrographis paniculata TaxID=175694 RepID=UPI0021E888A4|nr:thiamine-repressible mitochondrial transport protein THI74 [Andrographis paniculata]
MEPMNNSRSWKWKWILGLIYIVAVASIWIASSFVVQSVVDDGVSPFLVTYICNGLFVVYIPLVEIHRCLEDIYGGLSSRKTNTASEQQALLKNGENSSQLDHEKEITSRQNAESMENIRWTRRRVAKISLLICPIWFMAQLTFNLSLKYTTVTSNTILSSSSSLFSFIVALLFLGETFTWLKLAGILLCIGGMLAVSLGDTDAGSSAVASNPILGNTLAVLSAAFYAVYVTLIRLKLPDDDEAQGRASMAQFLGFLGLFNILIFLPVALFIYLAKIEPFDVLTGKQFGLIVGKGLLDNVVSEYLWAKAVLLTTTTVATAGLTVQVPLAAIVDSLSGSIPQLLDCIGAVAIMVGFTCINIPS